MLKKTLNLTVPLEAQSQIPKMDIFKILNSDLVFPILAFFVIIIYFVNRTRMRNRFKR